MKSFDNFKWNFNQCLAELEKLENLLSEKEELRETEDILPFFKKNKHLSAYIGFYATSLNRFDKIKYEFDFFGDCRADLVVGDSVKNCYCFIEFEDATKDSIFKNSNRGLSVWSSRFEQGFSQIIDWFWKINDFQGTSRFKDVFGENFIDFYGLLIIGRDQFISPLEKERLRWRSQKIVIDSHRVYCITFDQLAHDIRANLNSYLVAREEESNSVFES